MCVVALCTLENDLLHAGYLALALAFFRSRIALRVRRNRWARQPVCGCYLSWLFIFSICQLLLMPSESHHGR